MTTRPTTVARTRIAAAATLSFFFSHACLGAGFWLTETGAPDMSMASAGRAALATDASAIGANPAGIVELQGSSLAAMVLPLSMDLKFHGDGSTPGSASNQAGTSTAGALFASHSDGRWSLGLGIYSNAGLTCDLGDQWVGRRALEYAQVRTIDIAPAVAYRLADSWNVGASVGVQYADAASRLAVSSEAIYYGPPADLPDGQVAMSGSSWEPITNLGVTYQADSSTRLGLAWTSPVHHVFDLDTHAIGAHPVLAAMLQQRGAPTLEMPLPQQLTLSAAHQLTPDTLLAASAGWQDWSRFGHSSLDSGAGNAPMFEDGLKDTWNVAIGLRHRMAPHLALSTGIAYDSDPSTNGTMPIYFPIAEQLRLSAGADYEFSDDLLFRVALTVVNQGDVRIEQQSNPIPLPGIPQVTGTIEQSRVYLLGMSVVYGP